MELERFASKEVAIRYLKESRGYRTTREAENYLAGHIRKESYYQKKIMDHLKEKYPDAFVWKAAAGAYSRKGIPDICAVIDGRYYGFEVKRPLIGMPAKIQIKTIKDIQRAGGIAGVVCFPEEAEQMIEISRKERRKQ